MKGKPFVVVSENDFKNTKNGTRGSLIDLVAVHKNMTLLQSVAHINCNDRLLLLEQHMGEVKQSYRSFYVPKPDLAHWKVASEKLSHFLRSTSEKPPTVATLQEKGIAQVDRKGSVWLFPLGNASGALEFIQETTRAWTKKKHGKPRSPFASFPGSGSKAFVFNEPEVAIKNLGADLFELKKRKSGILALLEPDERLVDQYVSTNRHVRTIYFVSSQPSGMSRVELDIFNNLKRKYQSFGMGVEHLSHEKAHEKALEMEVRDSGLSL